MHPLPAAGSGEVLEDEADEKVVECRGGERQAEEVSPAAIERRRRAPAAATRDRALGRAMLAEMSTETRCAAGLRVTNCTVCAPVPQPTSSTCDPAG